MMTYGRFAFRRLFLAVAFDNVRQDL
jgi:hypothetical protein